MLKTIKDLYGSVEEAYLDWENKILDQAEDTYDLSKNYIENTSEEITIFFNEYFNNENIDDNDDPVLLQLNRLDNLMSTMELNSDEGWDSNLIFTATSLGHLNEKMTTVLCDHHKVNLYGRNNQANKINSLKDYLPKTIINDLHFINSFRNSILHHDDFGLDLLNLDKVSKNKLLSEAKAAIAKFEFVYRELKNIKIKKISKAL